MRCPTLLLGLALALAPHGCSSEDPDRVQVTNDQTLQLKFETARRVLADIKAHKAGGHNVYAECKTARMLFVKDLKRIDAPAVKRLVKDLVETCQKVAPP